MSSLWCELKSIGYRFFPTPIKISETQFAVVPSRWTIKHTGQGEKDFIDGIYAYDTNKNDWHKIFDYPKDLKTSSHSAVFDKNKNVIYIFNSSGDLLKCDLKTQQLDKLQRDPQSTFGSYPGFILENNKIHIFGEGEHAIYDIDNEIFAFQPSTGYTSHGKFITYLPTKNMIAIIEENEIQKYSLLDKKWSTTNIKSKADTISGFTVASAVTSDDKYVIMMNTTKEIWLYDVDTNVYSKSVGKNPSNENKYRAIIMSDGYTSDLLTFGYVRSMFDNLPLDIIDMIANWVTNEYLHLIENVPKGGKHWRIPLYEILQTK